VDKVRWAIDGFGTCKVAGEDSPYYKNAFCMFGICLAFRPVSLTSFFLKTMERLVDSYISSGPLKSFPPMESQYAYHGVQRGKSTEAALHDLVQKIKRSLNQTEFALDGFLGAMEHLMQRAASMG
jgi:hypothetical protein